MSVLTPKQRVHFERLHNRVAVGFDQAWLRIDAGGPKVMIRNITWDDLTDIEVLIDAIEQMEAAT